jgi:uncharacterized protein YbbC (DUF1343 family)
MGEMAKLFNEGMRLNADLKVVPAAGWRRSMWFDQTGLPWVRPSPNLPDLTSATVYPALVPYEGSNLSVGRGTPTSFQRFGALVVDSFMPRAAPDNKYNDRLIPGVHIRLTDRNAFEAGTVAAAILSAVRATNRDSLRLTNDGLTFDLRFGSPSIREAIMRGEDPLPIMAREKLAAEAFAARMRRFWIYQP